jgi:hypothetical protein
VTPPTPPKGTTIHLQLPWIVVGVFTLVVLGLFIALRLEASRARQNGLRADSLEAVADTTRRLWGVDSGVWVRRAVQTEIQLGVLDKLLKQKPVVVYRDSIVIKPVVIAGPTGPVTSDPNDSIRRGQFHVDSTPYHADVTAELPKAPSLGRISLAVSLDPIIIDAEVACGKAIGGVKPAIVQLTAPPWARVGLSNTQTAPDVCNAQRGFLLGGFSVPWWLALGTAGLGFLGGHFAH